jgi:hypothetical protein
MRRLGRRGGLAGGPARARALSPAQRSAIARAAARARWSGRVIPSDRRADLASFVAHYGSTVTPLPADAPLSTLAISAVSRSRRDASLARMLPVFLWRVRKRLDLDGLVELASQRGEVRALGFFLTAAAELGHTRRFDRALAALRARADPRRVDYFFAGTARDPLARMAADLNTPAQAKRWGLRMNVGWDSFASHFRKTANL